MLHATAEGQQPAILQRYFHNSDGTAQFRNETAIRVNNREGN
jgi:hypothetical protein